jgi:cytochrome c5
MASDEKRPQLVAREMVRKMEQANETIAVATGKGPGEVAEVTCMTCHRGSTIPEIEDAPAAD